MSVRVRFAPSPTGYLHIGGARTALFNYLFAKHEGGTFILRIEDTDVMRSSEKMTGVIMEDLKWLGVHWDEGPYFQSGRLDIYRRAAENLVSEGYAYRCFCTPEELNTRKKEAVKKGLDPIYDRKCLELREDQVKRNISEGKAYAIRFKVPDGITRFKDIVQKKIEVQNRLIEDFVLLRSDGMPTYHLCCVIDDADMKITHVIRGADHISNTPKQIMLYKALGKTPPRFAHIPLILGQDRSRLSKRHGATAVSEYRKQGYLPESFVYFLALMGWSPRTQKKVLTLDEMIPLFELSQVVKTNAMFDLKKLEWINGQFISILPLEKILPEVEHVLREHGLWQDDFLTDKYEYFKQAVELIRPRYYHMREFAELGAAFFSDNFPYAADAVNKYWSDSAIKDILEKLHDRYDAETEWTLESTEKVLRNLVDEKNISSGDVIGALRVAITGQRVAPPLFDVMVLFGKDKVMKRLKKAIAFLSKT